MVRVFFRGQAVPEWLERQSANADDSMPADITFMRTTAVYQRGGSFNVRPLFSYGPVIKVANAKNVTVTGQSPKGCDGDIYFHSTPAPIAMVTALINFMLGWRT